MTLRWLLATVVLLGIALWLTVPALRVNYTDGPGLLAMTAAQTNPPEVSQGTFAYSETPAGPVLEWQPSGPLTTDVVLWVSDVETCSDVANGKTQTVDAPSADLTPVFDEATIGNASKILVPAQGGITLVTCRLSFQPASATYSERRFQIVSDVSPSGADAQWRPSGSYLYKLTLNDAADLKVTNADPCCASEHQENTFMRSGSSNYHNVKVVWTNAGADHIHEFVYFLGAAIIGMSFSCLLEALRPLIARK